MKLALPVTLALGGLSLAIAVLAAFMFYVFWVSQPTLQYAGNNRSLATIVNTTDDATRLKRTCLLIAESQDTNDRIMRSQIILVERALLSMGLFSIGWGLISGVVFLYLHFLLRHVSRERESASQAASDSHRM